MKIRMPSEGDADVPSHLQWWMFGFVAVLYITWIAAWMLEEALYQPVHWLTTDGGQFVYWTLMKLVLWVLPAVILIRLSGRRVWNVIAFNQWRAALLWGLGMGLGLAAISLLTRAIGHQPLFMPQLNWGFVNAVVVAPIVEEITFRGAVLTGLLQVYRFPIANTLTALLFLGAHLPGWYFQGHLTTLLIAPVGGALSIFIIGWLLGFVKYQSNSVLGSILTHILNNLFSVS